MSAKLSLYGLQLRFGSWRLIQEARATTLRIWRRLIASIKDKVNTLVKGIPEKENGKRNHELFSSTSNQSLRLIERKRQELAKHELQKIKKKDQECYKRTTITLSGRKDI
ncbi:hypothetical protein YC2023_072662 [Brassica napus]